MCMCNKLYILFKMNGKRVAQNEMIPKQRKSVYSVVDKIQLFFFLRANTDSTGLNDMNFIIMKMYPYGFPFGG